MAAITILKNNVPTGPFTREQVTEKLQAGEANLEDLAFIEGLSQWTPLHEVLAKVDATAISSVPASVSPVYSQAGSVQSSGGLPYAGFGLRFVAYILDAIILGIPVTILSMIVGFIYGLIIGMTHPGAKIGFVNEDGGLNVSFVILELCIMTFSLVINWLYFALQESSSAQATFGKRILGIKVTDLQWERISFAHASGRFFSKILSSCTLLIGYIMAGFTEKKQALHDMIASTLVVRK